LKDIENVDKEKGFTFRYSGLVIVVRGFEELFFEFSRVDMRDDCAVTLLRSLESIKYMQDSDILDEEEVASAETAKVEHQLLQEARQESHAEHEIKMPKIINDIGKSVPFKHC